MTYQQIRHLVFTMAIDFNIKDKSIVQKAIEKVLDTQKEIVKSKGTALFTEREAVEVIRSVFSNPDKNNNE